MFLLPSSILPSVSNPVVEIWAKPLSEFNTKYSGVVDCFWIYLDACIVIMKSLVEMPLESVIYKNSNHRESEQAFFGGKFCRQFYLMT